MPRNFKHWLVLFPLVGSAAFAAAAWAPQARAADPSPAASEPTALGEVVVTAERRSTRLQETPAAVTSIDTQTAQALGTTNTRSLMGLVPSLYLPKVATAPSTQTYGMRGLAQSDTIADPTVAVYVDDIYLPRSIGAMFDMPDLARVEVLRGPQGTLYGRNATGGAIKFITRDPVDQFEANVSVGFGNFGQQQDQVFVGGPIYGDTVLASLSFDRNYRDGYVNDPVIGRKVNRLDAYSGRGKLLFQASDKFSIKLTVDGLIDDSDAAVYTASTPPPGQPFDPYTSYENNGYNNKFGPVIKLHEAGISAVATYQFTPQLTFKSISAARGFQGPYDNEDDGLPQVLIDSYSVYRQRQDTQEFQLLGDYSRLKFASGFYYFFEDYNLDIINQVLANLGAAPTRAIASQDTESYSVYGQGDYSLTDRLIFTFGGRYTYETRDYANQNFRLTPGTFQIAAMNYAAQANTSYGAFSPKVGLRYQADPNLMLYGSYAEGFQAGGFSFRAATATIAQAPFQPQYVRTTELGVRSEWFDHRARVNLTLFNNDISDMQLTAFDPALNTSRIQNAGAAYTRGVELETSALLREGLTLTANASYLQANYTRWDNPSGPGTTGVGKHFLFAPTWTGGASLIWKLPVSVPGELTGSADYRFQSLTYLDALNVPGNTSPAQDDLSLGLRYLSPNKHWQLSGAVHNLMDHTYKEFSFDIPSIGVNAFSYNLPRNFLFTLKYIY